MEEIFYPALRQVADDGLSEMLDEAEAEHTGAKDLIAELKAELGLARLSWVS